MAKRDDEAGHSAQRPWGEKAAVGQAVDQAEAEAEELVGFLLLLQLWRPWSVRTATFGALHLH